MDLQSWARFRANMDARPGRSVTSAGTPISVDGLKPPVGADGGPVLAPGPDDGDLSVADARGNSGAQPDVLHESREGVEAVRGRVRPRPSSIDPRTQMQIQTNNCFDVDYRAVLWNTPECFDVGQGTDFDGNKLKSEVFESADARAEGSANASASS